MIIVPSMELLSQVEASDFMTMSTTFNILMLPTLNLNMQN